MKNHCVTCYKKIRHKHPNQITCLDKICQAERKYQMKRKGEGKVPDRIKEYRSMFHGVYKKRRKIKREVIFPRKVKKKVARPDGTIVVYETKVNVPRSLCSCGQSFSDTFKLWVHIFQGRPLGREAILAYDKLHG